jgi:hypothetical protein
MEKSGAELSRRAIERWECEYGRMLPIRYDDGRPINYAPGTAAPPFVLFAVGLPMLWAYRLEGHLIVNAKGATLEDEVRRDARRNWGAVTSLRGFGFWK